LGAILRAFPALLLLLKLGKHKLRLWACRLWYTGTGRQSFRLRADLRFGRHRRALIEAYLGNSTNNIVEIGKSSNYGTIKTLPV
jgi:hypothetical protein